MGVDGRLARAGASEGRDATGARRPENTTGPIGFVRTSYGQTVRNCHIPQIFTPRRRRDASGDTAARARRDAHDEAGTGVITDRILRRE